MSDIRLVEMLLAFSDHTWGTWKVAIPANTPEDEVEEAAKRASIKIWEDSRNTAAKEFNSRVELALVAVYNDGPEPEGEEGV